MKKLAALLTLLVLFLTGCGDAVSLEGEGDVAEGPAEQVAPEDMTIGLSLSTLNNPFFVSVQEGVEAAAEESGSTVQTVDAQDDSAKQQNDMSDLIQQNVDIILVNPVDSAAIETSIVSANDAGIPVITIDRSSDGGQVVSLVASNNVVGGEMAAEYIIEQVGEGANVVQLEGTPGASATNERGQGFENIASESLNVIDSQTANFNRAEGLTVMENLLQSHDDIQAVFSQNDEMALGAIEAITAAGLSDEIVVVGFDGTEDGLASIENGDLDASVAQQPQEMGRLAVETAYSYMAGETVEENVASPLELITQ